MAFTSRNLVFFFHLILTVVMPNTRAWAGEAFGNTTEPAARSPFTRTWTHLDGRTANLTLLCCGEDRVSFRRSDDLTGDVDIANLVPADQFVARTLGMLQDAVQKDPQKRAAAINLLDSIADSPTIDEAKLALASAKQMIAQVQDSSMPDERLAEFAKEHISVSLAVASFPSVTQFANLVESLNDASDGPGSKISTSKVQAAIEDILKSDQSDKELRILLSNLSGGTNVTVSLENGIYVLRLPNLPNKENLEKFENDLRNEISQRLRLTTKETVEFVLRIQGPAPDNGKKKTEPCTVVVVPCVPRCASVCFVPCNPCFCSKVRIRRCR